jgi:GT2 family glycosyltransferase
MSGLGTAIRVSGDRGHGFYFMSGADSFVLRYGSVPTSGISIVVPTRDTREITLRCLATVADAVTAMPAEMILVDDGSQDGTAGEVRRRFPQVQVLHRDTPSGFTAAANAGLRAASHPLILLLNSDTEISRDAIHALLVAFDRDARLGIAGAQLLYPDQAGQWSGGAAPTLAWLFAESSGLARAFARVPGYRVIRPLTVSADRDVEWVTGAALAMRREVWDAVGPLDERFSIYAQDLDFCLRARDRGWAIRIIAGCRVVHHQGATISRLPGSPGRQHPRALWTDLVRWAEKRRGGGYARRAGRAIAAGARLRLLGRRLLGPAVPAALRDGWRGETHELQLALAALRGAQPAGRS